ncbi:hypothetical protein [Desulfovibrio sp.]|uniref:hypothetical protein n=1 Tax=Desulfovibrio sp. TaxID=885 RepID=UPI0023BCB685|nr:hypothetical protein [Desulfovibrio sp.]MDE7241465.1 helix-turn-helix domain containing protein [Desulfovibrio sp.]
MHWKYFTFVYEEYLKRPDAQTYGASFSGFARFLGVSNGRVQSWRENGKWPGTEDIALLRKKMGFAYHWLVTGEGEPYEVEAPSAPLADVNERYETEIQNLREELAEERRLNRQLTAKLLIDGVGDKAAATNTGKAADGHE